MKRFPFLFGEKQEMNRYALIKRKISDIRSDKNVIEEVDNNETLTSNTK